MKEIPLIKFVKGFYIYLLKENVDETGKILLCNYSYIMQKKEKVFFIYVLSAVKNLSLQDGNFISIFTKKNI